MLHPMEYSEAMISKVSPLKFKVLASARVHERQAAICPPVQMMQQVRQSETNCLFKIIIAMMAIGMIATIPFWSSEEPQSTADSIPKDGDFKTDGDFKNNTNITEFKTQKRVLNSKNKVAAPDALPRSAFLRVIPEDNEDLKIIIQRTDVKDINNNVEILEMAIDTNAEPEIKSGKKDDDQSNNKYYEDAMIEPGLPKDDIEAKPETDERSKKIELPLQQPPTAPGKPVEPQLKPWYIAVMLVAVTLIFAVVIIAICVLLFWQYRQKIFFPIRNPNPQANV